MTPAEFIQKWRAVDLKERTASQSHFNDICRLLDIEDPITADPKGEWFTFEKGASKTGGGEGWADVWRKECENWLNPPDLVERVPEVVEGYPDRILPKDEAAARELKKRTLTNLYNARPAWLDHAHRALDEAVAEAYGWGDDYRAGLLTDDEILARLFRLNQERANG